ncbi:phosphatidylethanolamine-binding protein [Lophiotrema nucula]|uniref:Phosphatidylethanolamine-binding protein n=1 Tax=Lophiotrema nucula TaxID=690887 RepID=A0A6A5Z532_9PLEO|nr:phosphatidylethanolamine-binding protein [Lophiotrema nucula]
MYFTTSVLLAALVSIAQAQTPKGFTPSVNTKLNVMFNTTSVATPGELLPKAATSSQPQLGLSSAQVSSANTFMFVMMDLDVPPQGTNTTRRTLLHAMVTDFKPTQQKLSNNTVLLASTQKGPAAYIAPGPPATDPVAHRYVQLLFQQPATLKVQASDFSDTSKRIGFDINAFMKTQGLSAPLAANFFTVDGKASGSASGTATGTATGTGGIAKNTLQPFTGGASRVEMTWLAGLVGGLAFMAA